MFTSNLTTETPSQDPFKSIDSLEIRKKHRENWERLGYHTGIWFHEEALRSIPGTLPKELKKFAHVRFTDIFCCTPERINRNALKKLQQALKFITLEEEGMELARQENILALAKAELDLEGSKQSLKVTPIGTNSHLIDVVLPKISTPLGFTFLLHYLREHKAIHQTTGLRTTTTFVVHVTECHRKEIAESLKCASGEVKALAKIFLLILDFEKRTTCYSEAAKKSALHARKFMDAYSSEREFPDIKSIAPFYTRFSALLAIFITKKNNSTGSTSLSCIDKVTKSFYRDREKLDACYRMSSAQKELYALIYNTTTTLISSWKGSNGKSLEFRIELLKFPKPIEQPSVLEKKVITVDSLAIFSSPKVNKNVPKNFQNNKQPHQSIEEIAHEESNLIPKKLYPDKEEKIESVPFEFFSEPPIKYYGDRVKRWFHLAPHEPIPFEEYREIKNLAYLEKIRIFHGFSQLVDHFAFDPNFAYADGNCRHLVVAYEFPDETFDTGITTYVFNDKDHTHCNHRFHSRRSPNEFLNLDLDEAHEILSSHEKMNLTAEKFVSCSYSKGEDTCVQNKHHGYMTIHDKTNDVKIHVFNKNQ